MDPQLTDAQWRAVRDVLPTQHGRGRPWRPHRTVVDAILWVVRTGRPWRSLPSRYGPWETAYARYRRWQADGTWQDIEAALTRAEADPVTDRPAE